MRTLRLARVAAEAEGLLLRRRLRRTAIRASLAAVAALFAIAAIAMLHVFVLLRLVPVWGPETAALSVGGGDLLLAIILALVATLSPSDRIATEAARVRDQALNEMRSVFTVTSLLRPLTGLLLEQWLLRRRKRD